MCTAGDTHNCTEGLFSRSNVCFSWLDSTQVEFWWIPYFLKLFVHVSKSHIIFSNLNSNSSNLIDLRNLQQQVKHCTVLFFSSSSGQFWQQNTIYISVSFFREDFCVQPPCGQLNPMVDEMYEVLEQVFKEYFEIFQFDSFHYGGDEVCFNQTTRRKSFFIFIQSLTLFHSLSLRSWKVVALHAPDKIRVLRSLSNRRNSILFFIIE